MFYHFSNCGLFKWERDGMLKVKSLSDSDQRKKTYFSEIDLMLLFIFYFRRNLDPRSVESSSCLEERSTASSSTVRSDDTELLAEGARLDF